MDDQRTPRRALVLLSGGLDSSTLVAKLVQERGDAAVATLCIAYGQKHDRERSAARAIADYYGVPLETLDLTAVFAHSGSSLLAHSAETVPHSAYDQQRDPATATLPSTYVPFRNGLFLSAAASMALAVGCDELYYAAHHDDTVGDVYPDCSAAFVEAMGAAIATGTDGLLKLHAPFVTWTKADIVALGLKLGVPYELTWSCYEGGATPCGVCGTCVDRRRAFEANGAIDPLTTPA